MRYRYLLLSVLAFVTIGAQAQNFTTDQYKKALWMTTRFYGGQRSGYNNWLLNNHLPSGLAESYRGTAFKDDKDTDGYDLSGGWHDCGDHVKFGQTEFYSAYMLLKGYSEFPAGYDDYYSATYANYASTGKWSWEEAAHDPNGIPDILDEVKHATDYFIKCTRNATTFYYQVGDGGPDHTNWVTATKMQTLSVSNGGQTRSVYKNPADASMASFCGATLALMSRMYRPFDPAYADVCLAHAVYAYTYAKAHPGVASDANGGSYYGANDNWKDDYCDMCAELFWATNTDTYKTEALKYTISAAPGQGADIYGKNYDFDYTNNGDIAIYNQAKLGNTNAVTVLTKVVNDFYFGNVQTDGQFNGGNTDWGPLRYNANTAFIVALWQKLKGTEATPNAYIYNNIDYILGKNSSKFSFVVGFGANAVTLPHHRNVYLRDDNPTDAVKQTMPIPTKNAQFGLLVGGSRNPSSFSQDVVSFKYTEGGIDYNACLVGALAYIRSVKDPVNTSKFGHPTPKLGDSKSICGVASIILDSKITPDTKKTYTWIQDGTTKISKSLTASTYTVTAAGVYECVLDSVGWSTTSKVTITGELAVMDLGADKVLCDPATATLTSNVTGLGIAYVWKKGTTTLTNNTASITVYGAGTYSCTASATGCASVSDAVIVTSSLPTVQYDTICKAGTATLKVTSTGSFQWFDVATGGTALASTATYSPSITASKTYYVQDASSVAITAGPTTTTFTATGVDWGKIGVNFTAKTAFKITGMTIKPYALYNTNPISMTVELSKGGTVIGTYSTATVTNNGVTNYVLTFTTPIDVPSAGDYTLKPAESSVNTPAFYQTGPAYSTYSNANVIVFTGATNGTASDNPLPAMFDWKISAGSTCARTPVFAVIDANNAKCSAFADTDGDGTPDGTDGCPLDKNKIAAGQCGCGVVDTDTDKDGKADCVDDDDDNDGTLDLADCAPLDATIGAKIWYADTDGDGVGDQAVTSSSCIQPNLYVATFGDLCPSDKTKTTPGTCGCGVPEGTCDATQTIALAAGWNIISLYVQPTDSSIANVFSSISSSLLIVKNNTSFYKTGQAAALNSLATVTRGQAYFVKTSAAGTLTIKGKPLSATKVAVATGWNLIGYPNKTAGAIATVLSPSWTTFQAIKNFDGFYIKNGTTNSITNMTPGVGYFIKMSAAGTVTIP